MNATPHDDDREPVEAEVVPDAGEGQRSVSRSLAKLTASPPVRLAVTPDEGAAELKARLDVIQAAMTDAMVDGVDYGLVPGVSKPTLLKPGAEKLGVLFQLNIQIVNDKTWGPGDHLTVESRAVVTHAPTGTEVGFGEGLCTTREKKYAKRKLERECPECGKTNIRRSKPRGDEEPGWYCWRKTDGCGANFEANDARITSQEVGEIDNPDLPDLWNTVVKMAEKRARVDAVLAVTGASALFTQDVEDAATAAAERTATSGPLYGPAPNDQQLKQTRLAIAYVLQVEEGDQAVTDVLVALRAVTDTDPERQYIPYIGARGITTLATAVKQQREPEEPRPQEAGDGDPAQETPEEKEERERAEQILADEQASGEAQGSLS